MGCGASSGKPVGTESQTVEPKQLTANAQLVSETQQKKSLQAPPNIIEEESDAKLQDPSSRHSAGSTRRDGTESLGGSNNIDNGGGEYKTEGPRRRSQNSVISEGGNDSMRSGTFGGRDRGAVFEPLLREHARFLVNFVAVLDRNSTSGRDKSTGAGQRQQESTFRQRAVTLQHEAIAKPKLEVRQFKSHTMDNVRVRKVCDELLHLEDTNHPLPQDSAKDNKAWMRTLQISVGKHVHCIKMNNNPEVKIGGYFLISQMLSYIRGLVSLDISSNDLRAAEARVLSLGLKTNKSVQELRMRDNSIGSEGSTSMADMLKVNDTLLLLDLRMNNIRGAGVCVLADAVSDNTTITELDMRWNYAGECSNFVELALTDLKKFTHRNMLTSLVEMYKQPPAECEPDAPNHLRQENGESPRLSEAVTEKQDSNQQGHRSDSANTGPELSLRERPADFGLASIQGLDDSIGRLEVTILSAKNLPQVIWTAGKDGEFLGLPQAYCVFTLNKQTTQTMITKKDWSPVWMYTFSMKVREVWQVCSVKVMHSKSLHRTHRDDYTIGNVNLPVGAVINWRGVSHGADGSYRAFHRPMHAGPGTIYQSCKGKDKNGRDTDVFETEVEAAKAYDDVALKLDGEKAALNFAGDGVGEKRCLGQHVKEESFALSGEDGISVIGVQAGVPSTVRLRLKFFANRCKYLEIHLDRGSSLPKMDTGLGSCDAYCIAILGDYKFRSRVVRNSLDPEFMQTFRMAVTDETEELQLKVELWDWDRIGDDDRMGEAIVKFTPQQTEDGKLDGMYTLTAADVPGGGGGNLVKNSKGELSHLHLRFTYSGADTAESQPAAGSGGF
mmetsp:Transcript_23308/g.55499  ORF Transcript_23308/g.55499 Transcript_23308/m.55499 type:complete len:838 (+) Transcript_23308:233-2746(+)